MLQDQPASRSGGRIHSTADRRRLGEGLVIWNGACRWADYTVKLRPMISGFPSPLSNLVAENDSGRPRVTVGDSCSNQPGEGDFLRALIEADLLRITTTYGPSLMGSLRRSTFSRYSLDYDSWPFRCN